MSEEISLLETELMATYFYFPQKRHKVREAQATSAR
jgi:hypothetical protein